MSRPPRRPAIRARRRPRRLGARLGLAIGATLCFFLLVELASRWMWTEQELWPTPFHEILVDHPTLVGRLRPNMVASLRGGQVLRTNSLGLRDQEHSLPKPAGRLHLLALGESSTMGDWVAAEDAYPEQLEARWIARGQDVEVIHAGLGAWSVWLSWVFLDALGERLEPDIFLVHSVHPTPEGHAFIAQAISTGLDQARVWPDGASFPTRGP